jgi:hypothetical protein
MGRVGALALLALSLPATAEAATFHVTKNGVSGSGTLSSAISHANSNGNPGDVDAIKFDLPLQDNNPYAGGANVITIDTEVLPVITEPVKINGCSGVSNPSQPCVVLRQLAMNDTALDVESSRVKISGFILVGWNIGVQGDTGTSKLVVKNNWFGTTGSGAAEPVDIGIRHEGNKATIGGTRGDGGGSSGATRNVFAGCAQYCVAIRGGKNNSIVGNYFELSPAATTAGTLVPSEDIIEVTGFPSDPATGNVIGGTLTSDALATPACDGSCNLIPAMAIPGSGYAIDLDGDTGAPSQGTTISGNHLGTNLDATAPLGSGTAELRVGDADGVLIGGPKAKDGNVIAGPGDYGVTAGPGAEGLEIRRNLIGVNGAGTVALPAAITNVDVDHALVDRNRMGGVVAGGPTADGLHVEHDSMITNNVFGVGTGGQDLGMRRALHVTGNGNAIEANVLGFNGGAFAPIDLDGANGNQVSSNRIGTDGSGAFFNDQGDGIRLRNGSSNNVIGGPVEFTENVISNSAGFAIHLTDDGTDNNIILRARGGNNGGTVFWKLDPSGPSGPNAGTAPPAISAASATQASGTALPFAVVQIYQTGSVASQIDGFLGQATADGAGNWTVVYSTPLTPGQYVAASQTPQATQNTSELTPAFLTA